MDDIVVNIVRKYVKELLNEEEEKYPFEVFVVWKCKTLQNWKYIVSTDLYDGRLYELTYNGNRNEWYLDVYMKQENRVYTQATASEKEK